MNGPGYTKSLVHDWSGVRIHDPERVQPGATLVAATWREFDWKPGLKLIDSTGRVLHQWRADPDELFPGAELLGDRELSAEMHGSYVFANGDALVTNGYMGTARVDACGNVKWRLVEGTHHAISRAGDGSFWLLKTDRGGVPTGPGHPDGYPGLDFAVFDDRVIRVSEHGEVLQEISILDVLYANGLQRHLALIDLRSRADILHANDVEPLSADMAAEYPLFEAGDLVISLRHANLIFVLDPRTGRVKWHEGSAFIRQHDPDFIGGGWIGLFDNNVDRTERGTMLGGSRVLAIQAHTDSLKVLFPGARSDPFYTEARGNWQLLPNGNLLLTESYAGRVVEVTPGGRTVWEWVAEPYSETRVPELADSHRYAFTSAEIDSWPCGPGEHSAPAEED
jgi:hypothetical protein